MSIAREDDYRKKIIAFYNSVLHGRLLNLDLKTVNDSELMSFVSIYDVNELYFNNCCTWIEIGDIGSSNYNGYNYSFINLLPSNGEPIHINFSQFEYEMCNAQGQEGFPSFDEERAVHVSLIDNQRIEPYSFFSTNKGKKLLFIYSFEGVNVFCKRKRCYYFAFKNISAKYLRKYIYNTQVAVLKQYILYPAEDAPYTRVKIEIEGAENSRPTFQDMKGGITDDFAVNVFESEFKELFLHKLKEIETLDI